MAGLLTASRLSWGRASVPQKTLSNLSAGNIRFSGRRTDPNESKLELLNSKELFIEL